MNLGEFWEISPTSECLKILNNKRCEVTWRLSLNDYHISPRFSRFEIHLPGTAVPPAMQKKNTNKQSNLRSRQNSLGLIAGNHKWPIYGFMQQQFGKNVRIFRHLDGPSLIPEGHLISHPVIPISNNKIITWDANPDRSLMAEFRKTHPPTFRLSDGKVNRPTLPPGTLCSIVAGIVFRR